jgi:hypothetical protein
MNKIILFQNVRYINSNVQTRENEIAAPSDSLERQQHTAARKRGDCQLLKPAAREEGEVAKVLRGREDESH